jgi:hypothetical protein
MVIREFYLTREDGVNLFRTYSDEGFEIQKVGTTELYIEAIDIEGAEWNYIETPVRSIHKGLEDQEQELTQEEIATMLKEVF